MKVTVIGASGVIGQKVVREALASGHVITGIARHADSLSNDLDCTHVTPAAFLDTGVRTGGYRRGGGALLVDSTGESRVSVDDFAIAVVDETEKHAIRLGGDPFSLERMLLAQRRYALIS